MKKENMLIRFTRIATQRRKSHRGFTMVEILMVMIILSILAAIALPRLTGNVGKAKNDAARIAIDMTLTNALDRYEMDNETYPSTEQGLRALLKKPASTPVPNNWQGPYLRSKKMPLDPWGREYVYTSPGIHNPEDFDLSSLGTDGVESDDDIVNWVDESNEGEI